MTLVLLFQCKSDGNLSSLAFYVPTIHNVTTTQIQWW